MHAHSRIAEPAAEAEAEAVPEAVPEAEAEAEAAAAYALAIGRDVILANRASRPIAVAVSPADRPHHRPTAS